MKLPLFRDLRDEATPRSLAATWTGSPFPTDVLGSVRAARPLC